MLLTIQFPLADLRPFISGATNRLLKPPWPRARADEDFVRLFGSVRKRLKGGVDEWSGEGIYCDAARAIRFTPALELGGMFGATRRRGAFRRFFSDGEGASRVEIGIRIRRKSVWWTLKELLEALHDTLALNVTIGRGHDAVKTQLIKAGRPLARLVLRASTSAKAAAEFQPGTWWVRPCTPTLLIEYEQFREFLPLPPGFTAVKNETTFPFELSYGLMKFFDRSIGVWVLVSTAGKTTDDDYRRFRIHLLRLHAQREVVTEVLRQIQTQTLTVERTTPRDDQQHPSNRLQRFVVNNIEQMERQTYNGIPQSALLRAAEQIQDSVTPGERAAILEGLRPLRRHVSNVVERFTEAKASAETIVVVGDGGSVHVSKNIQNFSGTFQGDVNANQVVAKTIENSFNRVENAQVSDDLKARLQEVNELVREMVKKLPPDEQEAAARDLEAFTTQATATKPDRRWYEFSAQGLMEAAKAVADFAKPVTAAVQAVLALLA